MSQESKEQMGCCPDCLCDLAACDPAVCVIMHDIRAADPTPVARAVAAALCVVYSDTLPPDDYGAKVRVLTKAIMVVNEDARRACAQAAAGR